MGEPLKNNTHTNTMATATRFPKFRVANKNYEYNASSFSTRSSWGHNCTLYCNGCEVANSHIVYLNRTWESYQYQSAIHRAISNYFDACRERLISQWKSENNRTRITQAEREQLTRKLTKEEQTLKTKIDQYNHC